MLTTKKLMIKLGSDHRYLKSDFVSDLIIKIIDLNLVLCNNANHYELKLKKRMKL